MKHLNTYITEYIIKKKLDTPIDSENHYNYCPKSKGELKDTINKLMKQRKSSKDGREPLWLIRV